jgi:hypothetical protein
MSVDVRLTEGAPSPAQVVAWVRLWQRLLAEPDRTDAPEGAASEASSRRAAGQPTLKDVGEEGAGG